MEMFMSKFDKKDGSKHDSDILKIKNAIKQMEMVIVGSYPKKLMFPLERVAESTKD